MTADGLCFHLNQFVTEGYERGMFADQSDLRGLEHYLPAAHWTEKGWPKGITFSMEADKIEDVPYQVDGWLLFSERLKKAVEAKELKGATFLPIEAIWDRKEPCPRYWYTHLVEIVNAIDFDRSTYTYLGRDDPENPPLLLMVKFVLKESVIAGWDLFRVAESRHAEFCSGRFRDLFTEGGFTGLGFHPIRLT
jgi:hypothetical protein